MEHLSEAMQRYVDILALEAKLSVEKEVLRQSIRSQLQRHGVSRHSTEGAEAFLAPRFTLTPKEEPLLRTLQPTDLLPFTSFTPRKISELLVPRYGREKLLPCFDVKQSDVLVVRRERRRPPRA
ncbi:MAG: hypothetical protein AB2A00_41000 [Myxococcota bacterium]